MTWEFLATLPVRPAGKLFRTTRWITGLRGQEAASEFADEGGVAGAGADMAGNLDVRVTDVPDPRIQEPSDAIIAVTSTAICGSDLHLYGVLGPYLSPGDVLGHEAMGVVTEVGADVTNLVPGDRVVIPFNISCGHCWMCTRGLYAQCETTQVREQGKGAALFGYTSLYGSIPGGQAQFLRVPQAPFGPVKIPADGPDEQYLFLSDVLPTAYQAVAYADTPKDGTLAVLGLGPIGQFAARIAKHLGVERVIGADPVPERRGAAARFGVEAVDLNETADAAGMLIEMTGGRGPDAVIDAVGMEAHGRDEAAGSKLAEVAQRATGLLPDRVVQKITDVAAVDRLDALHVAVKAVRRGGTVSVSGVYGGEVDPMPMMEMFDRGIQLRMGQAHVKRWIDDLMPMVADSGDPLGVQTFATHHLPLEQAPHGYEIFRNKADGCIKIVLQP
jgi:threonine dehydrogenase-like Zn-dependent dehydrogenase